MRLVAERDDLLSALDRTRRVTPGVKDSPASARARISAADDTLTIYGSDLTVFMACRMPASVASPGEIGVVPADLAEMVRRMPEASKIGIDAKDGRISISADGSKRTFKLPYVDTTDLPTHRGVSQAGDITIAGDVLAGHMKRVIVAAYHGGDRAAMCGVGFDGREMSLRLAATDGLRMSVSDVDGVAGDGSEAVRLLHLSAARVVAAEATEMGNVGVVVDDRGFSFTSEHVDIYVPHIGATFPPYEFILNRVQLHTRVIIDVREMIGAVQAMGVVSKAMKMSLRNGVHLFAHGANDVADDEVAGDVTGKGGTVYVSTPLFLDALKGAPSAKIEVAIGSDTDPVMLTSNGYKALIMPIAASSMGEAA